MTIGQALWPDQLTAGERASLAPGVPLDLDRRPQVLIVGGGMLGLATAAACVQAGLGSVVVLERDRLGAGATGGAAGLLLPEAHVDDGPAALVDLARRSLDAWRGLERTWPMGVGLLDFDWFGQPQARVNPLRALARLAAGLPGVASGVCVTDVTVEAGRVRSLGTTIGAFTPAHVVFATGLPPRLAGLDLEVPASAVKGHMLVSAATAERVPASLGGLARHIENGRIMLGGTHDVDDHSRVVRDEVIDGMWADLTSRWPPAAGIAIDYRWACFRPAHADHLPVIDRLPAVGNAWLTSGHYTTGILLAAASGQALAAWIGTGRAPAELEAFGVARLLAG